MSSPRLILSVSLLALLAGGCAKLQARTEPVLPELVPPPPPPRVVETYADGAPAIDAAAESAGAASAARSLPKPAPPPAAVRPEPAVKPEPPRAESERPASPPALTLKPASGAASTTEGSIRNLLGAANRDLSRVDYGALNQDGKTQYDMAKRFIQQAEDALRGGNLVFAGKLADKAATMAAVLVR